MLNEHIGNICVLIYETDKSDFGQLVYTELTKSKE